MKLKHALLAMAAASIALVSCQKVVPGERVDEQYSPTFTSKVEGSTSQIHTRAHDAIWEAGDEIGIYMKGGASMLTENSKYTTDVAGNMTAAGQAIKFPIDGSEVDFVGYYPYKTSVSGGIFPVDISTQSPSSAIDLLYSNNATGHSLSKYSANLNFKHQLTKIQIKVVKGGAITDLTGMTAVISGLNTKASFNLADGTLSGANTVANIAAVVNGEYIEAIVLPTTDLTNFKLTFTLPAQANASFSWKDAGNSFVAGKKHVYNLNEVQGEIVLVGNSTIEDWTEIPGGSHAVTPEGGGEPGTGTEVTIAKFLTDNAAVAAATEIIEDIYVVGTVTATSEGSGKNINRLWLQSGGDALAFYVFDTGLTVGNSYKVSLKGLHVTKYAGIIQIQGATTALDKAVFLANVENKGAAVIAPREVTDLSTLGAGDVGTLLTLKGISFVEADGTATFGDAAAHLNRTAKDALGVTLIVRTLKDATFKGQVVPGGTGSITGILGSHNGALQFSINGVAGIGAFEGGGVVVPGESAVFVMETFGDGNHPSGSRPTIAAHTGFVNGSPIKFSDPSGNADIRSTNTITASVWLPTNKDSYLTISNIKTSGLTNPKLVFDLCANTAKATANMIQVLCNGTPLTVPTTALKQNEFVTVTVPGVAAGENIKIEFYSQNGVNTEGIRIDNIAIVNGN